MTTVYYQPIKSKTPSKTYTAPEVETQIIEPESAINEKELKLRIETESKNHKRPISDSEYDKLFYILSHGYERKSENLVYEHKQAAIARTIIENYKKFFPEVEIHDLIKQKCKIATELKPELRGKYLQSYAEVSAPFKTLKAEKVPRLYSSQEKERLKASGIAFLNYKKVIKPKYTIPVQTKLKKKADTRHPISKYLKRE